MKNINYSQILTITGMFMALTFGALIFPGTAHGFQKTYATSAALAKTSEIQPVKKDDRVDRLKAYLESYDSPLAEHAQTFVDEADKNNIDWRWVAAIAGVESWYGQKIPYNSYNGWGYGVYGNNVRRFNSWDDGIATVSKALRDDYMNKWGAKNIAGIGSKYAADPKWAYKVQHFLTDMEQFEARNEKIALPISI